MPSGDLRASRVHDATSPEFMCRVRKQNQISAYVTLRGLFDKATNPVGKDKPVTKAHPSATPVVLELRAHRMCHFNKVRWQYIVPDVALWMSGASSAKARHHLHPDCLKPSHHTVVEAPNEGIIDIQADSKAPKDKHT